MKSKVYSDLQKHLISSLKDRDSIAVNTLRTLLSEIKNFAIKKRVSEQDLIDTDVLRIIEKQVKQRKESIEAFTKGNRADLVKKEQKELAILQRYLPKKLTEDELKKVVKEALERFENPTMSNMGEIMSFLKQKYGASLDMKIASNLVKDALFNK